MTRRDPPLTLVTPTSDRPVAWQLCQRWIGRQEYDGEVQWVVADDGTRAATCVLGQDHVRLAPANDPVRSFRRNLAAALQRAKHERVIIIEDDDYYPPNYLREMADRLERADLAGEGNARYYNLRTRRYRLCGNRDHASLSQTALRGLAVELLQQIVDELDSKFIDIRLWRTARRGPARYRVDLRPESELVVGIKGLPGKAGLGIGHRLGERDRRDDDWSVLERWVGPEAAAIYRRLVEWLYATPEEQP